MKTVSVTLPIVILSVLFVGVWGLGMLAVKASATSTQASLDLLRRHLEVAQIHDRLLVHSKRRLDAHLAELAQAGAVTEESDELAQQEASVPPARRPWPSPPSASPPSLNRGLKAAQPVLGRLAERYGDAVQAP